MEGILGCLSLEMLFLVTDVLRLVARVVFIGIWRPLYGNEKNYTISQKC